MDKERVKVFGWLEFRRMEIKQQYGYIPGGVTVKPFADRYMRLKAKISFSLMIAQGLI